MRVLATTLLCLAALSATARASDCPGADIPTSVSTTQMSDAMLCLLNEQRASAGVPALMADAQLAQIATTYAGLMATENFFSHVSPEGQTMQERFAAADYRFDAAGENIASATGTGATPANIIDAWMLSADHRENILDPDFHQLGVGYSIGATDSTGVQRVAYVTEFGTPLATPLPARRHHRRHHQRRHHHHHVRR